MERNAYQRLADTCDVAVKDLKELARQRPERGLELLRIAAKLDRLAGALQFQLTEPAFTPTFGDGAVGDRGCLAA